MAENENNDPEEHPVPQYVADAPSPPTLADVRAALLNFLELADLCLTTPQRGYTPATLHDYKAFDAIAKALKKATETEPLHRSPNEKQKQAKLTPAQIQLGELRERFDWLSNCAARQRMTASRDHKLTALLYVECEKRSSSFGITFEMVAEAVSVIRSRNARLDRPDDDPDGEPDLHDWLLPRTDEDVTQGSKDRRQQANDAAGDILEEIIKRCPVTLSCGFTRGSTSDYAIRFRLNFDAILARSVTDNECLTLLTVLLGARLHEAPWIAFRIRLLVSGRDLDVLANPEWEDDWTPDGPLNELDEFRLPRVEEWRTIRDAFLRRFEAAGRPAGSLTTVQAYRIVASHLRRATRHAGREIPPKHVFVRLVDPFDDERAVRKWDELMTEEPTEPQFDGSDDPLEFLAGVMGDAPITTTPPWKTPGFWKLLEIATAAEPIKCASEQQKGSPSGGTKPSGG